MAQRIRGRYVWRGRMRGTWRGGNPGQPGAGSLRGKKELRTSEWVGPGGGVLRVASAHFSKRKPSHSGWGTCSGSGSRCSPPSLPAARRPAPLSVPGDPVSHFGQSQFYEERFSQKLMDVYCKSSMSTLPIVRQPKSRFVGRSDGKPPFPRSPRVLLPERSTQG